MNKFEDVQAPSVTEYGNSMLLRLAMEDLKPLLVSAFPANWEAIYALSMINPGAVSKLLRTIGVDREGQDMVFQGILDHSEQLIYDLSTTFSRSMSIQQAEKGYDKIWRFSADIIRGSSNAEKGRSMRFICTSSRIWT